MHFLGRGSFEKRAPLKRFSRESTLDRKSTRLNSSHSQISYAVFCLKKKNKAAATVGQAHTIIAALSDGWANATCQHELTLSSRARAPVVLCPVLIPAPIILLRVVSSV